MSIVRYLGFRRSIIGILCLFFLPLASLEGADTPELNFLVRGRVVDESGEPIADAVVRTLGRVAEQKVYSTKSGSSGAFAMKVPSHGSHGPAFLVTDATGKLVSFVSPFSYTTDERRLIKVVLRPWKETQVTVVNDAGKPVSEATVVLQADYMELVRGTTNEDGATTLKFPSDARVDWINALKDNVGYDYYENYDAFPTQERLDVPKQIQLQLAGAVKVKVTVVDDLKRPDPMQWSLLGRFSCRVNSRMQMSAAPYSQKRMTRESPMCIGFPTKVSCAHSWFTQKAFMFPSRQATRKMVHWT